MALTVGAVTYARRKSAKVIHRGAAWATGGELSVDNLGGLEYVSCI